MGDHNDRESEPRPSRRAVLRGVAAAGVSLPLVVACGSGSSSGAGSGSGSGSQTVADTSEVPEGGGIIDGDAGVVVTQPSPGTFKGFSSTCTHMGCTVGEVSGGTINCPCHGSQFSIKDGSVVHGPATRPLPKVAIKVTGDKIRLASGA
jgi:Rieske Fe-S protein